MHYSCKKTYFFLSMFGLSINSNFHNCWFIAYFPSWIDSSKTRLSYLDSILAEFTLPVYVNAWIWSLSRFWSITSFESPADFHGDEIKEIWIENWRLFLTTLSGIDLHKMWHVCSGCPIKGHVKMYKFLNIHTYPPISDISTST